MRLIDAEPIEKFIEKGLNESSFGHDAIEILTEIQFAPTVEAFAAEEIEAAVKDRRHFCRARDCASCEYKTAGCFTDFTVISKFLRVYRKRKEAGK